MRTLKLHFPDDALPTLDTFLKQTKEARVFRRAQAVREVVKGQRLQTVSDALQFTYSALRKWVYRFANQGMQAWWIARAPVDRPKSRVRWNSTSIASSIKTPSSMAPSIPSGVAANSRPSWPAKPASNLAAKVSAAC